MKYGVSLLAIVAATAAVSVTPAEAQSAPAAADQPASTLPPKNNADLSPSSDEGSRDIVVTGSRIRQTSAAGAAPSTSFGIEAITERGFTQIGDMLNLIPSNAPQFQIAPFAGYPIVSSGQQSPNLFNLGAERTLSLINGRRVVPSSSGVFGSTVDTNIVPVGLIDRVDVVEAGGAAVYGSGAIAGVVNYVLKKNYQGISLDVQSGITTRGDYEQPSVRFTAGRNFADGRGNIAIDAEYSSTSALAYSDRPYAARGAATVPNAANASTSDGISPTSNITNATFFFYNPQGIIFKSPLQDFNFSLDSSRLIRLNGSALQFAADGQSVVAFNTGTIQSSVLASGGDGYPLTQRSTLYGGTQRLNGTVVAHYDFDPAFRLSGQFSYSHTDSSDPLGLGGYTRTIGAVPFSSDYGVLFNKSNPFLTAQDVTTLSAASSYFAGGGNLLLSKEFDNVLPSRERPTRSDTWSGTISIDGDFKVAGRDLYYSASYAHGQTTSLQSFVAQYSAHLTNALSATRTASGNIVCSINADASTTNDDAACVPINPFSTAPLTAAQQAYATIESGTHSKNLFDDALVSLGGSLVDLPGGDVKFSAAYEHRSESATNDPFAADLQGLPYGDKSFAESGGFRTNEFSGELSVPLVGKDFTLPLMKALEVNGSFRYIDNSLAGHETVWGAGARWEVGGGLALRGTISRNFRAPTLDDLYAASNTALAAIQYDPCSKENINSGSAPQTRLANCTALFAANPGYGSLATFVDTNQNTSSAEVTTGGNPNLKNEVSRTKTFGAVWQPSYIRGLTVSVDAIIVDLTQAIVSYSPASFLSRCYDTGDSAACATFTRGANGFVITALSASANAGYIKYRGQTFKAHYDLALDTLFPGNTGVLSFGGEATHTGKYETSATGLAADAVRSDGTAGNPDWRVLGSLTYRRGPLKLFYSINYYPPQKSGYYDTVETTPNYHIAATSVSSASVQYQFGHLSLRAGLDNIFDSQPSFPTFTYGDPLGRRVFVGANVRF